MKKIYNVSNSLQNIQLVKKCIYLGIIIKFVFLECSISLWPWSTVHLPYDLWTS